MWAGTCTLIILYAMELGGATQNNTSIAIYILSPRILSPRLLPKRLNPTS